MLGVGELPAGGAGETVFGASPRAGTNYGRRQRPAQGKKEAQKENLHRCQSAPMLLPHRGQGARGILWMR